MKRPKTTNSINRKNQQQVSQTQNNEYSENMEEEGEDNYLAPELKENDLTSFIYSLFSKKIYAEIYYAWCKDCKESPSAESAKYFREELLSRNNKDLKNFYFRSLRVGRNFLAAFGGNLPPAQIYKLELPDNLVNDECMHNIKNLISARQVIHLNLASNQISTEGLKIIQHEVIASKSLKYLNLGVSEGSFRVNNFSGDGGIIIARILLNNESIETLILQENSLGEDAGDKIGAALIQNKKLKKLVLSDNKIKNKGARSIIENGTSLVSIDLSENDINPEVCYDLKKLDIARKIPRLAGHRAVCSERSYDLPAVEKRHAHERQGLVWAARLRAVQEAAVLAHIADDLGLARLRDETGDALPDMVAAERALFGIQRTRRGDYPKLVAFEKRKRSAQHAHAALKDTEDVFEKFADIAPPRDRGSDLAQNGHF